MADQTGEQEFTMVDGTTQNWTPPRTDYYRLKVGAGGAPNFGGSTISVEQDGDPLQSKDESLDSVDAYIDRIVHLIGKLPVDFIPSGAVTSVKVIILNE